MTRAEFVRLGRQALKGWAGAEYKQIDVKGVFPLDWRPHALIAESDGSVRLPAPAGTYVHPVETSFRIIADLQTIATAPDVKGADYVDSSISRAVDSLIGSQLIDGSFRYPVAVRRYSVSPGWSSGMAQGLAYHALCAASPFLEPRRGERARYSAGMAIEHLLSPIAVGGCSDYDEYNRPFFEECPSRPLPYIFNGAVFAILGLATSSRPPAEEAARMAAERLAQMLPLWNLGYWSRYDSIDRTPSSPNYHNLHIELLRSLSRCYPELPFAAFADRFAAQREVLANRLHSFSALVVNRTRSQLFALPQRENAG